MQNGKPMDDKSMAFAMCQASLKLEESQDGLFEEGFGPTLTAAAVTAKPHLPQRGKEIKLVEIDGKKYVEVPLLRKGIYRHPKGKLVFSDRFINRMVENHANKVTDYPVHLDFRHSDTQGSLAFLDPEDGGWLEYKPDGWLYGYGVPADKQAEQIIESRKWRFASPEFWTNYKSNLVSYKLSADELRPVDESELLEEIMEKTITFGDVVIKLEGADGAYTLDGEGVSALDKLVAKFDELAKLAQEVEQLKAKVGTLTQEKAELEKKVVTEEEPEIPEPLRLRLEALERRNAELEQTRLRDQVALTISQAEQYIDSEGRGHSPVFLELVRKGLLLEAFDGANGAIQLEAQTDAGVTSYYRNLLKRMTEIVPGQMPKDGKTGHEESPDFQLSVDRRYSYTEDELKQAIEAFGRY